LTVLDAIEASQATSRELTCASSVWVMRHNAKQQRIEPRGVALLASSHIVVPGDGEIILVPGGGEIILVAKWPCMCFHSRARPYLHEDVRMFTEAGVFSCVCSCLSSVLR
jgi:hypothetical protein